MASSTESAIQINVAAWHNDLRATYEAGKIGPGAVALLEVINLQLAQAATWTADVTEDVYIERALVSFNEDLAASRARLAWLVNKLAEIVASETIEANKVLAIHNWIARPVLDGHYPADMLSSPSLDRVALRGIAVKPDGSGKGMGEAYYSATLWNQAVIAGDINRKLGTGWATDAIRGVLTTVATQLERSAPGEDTTAADAVAEKLRDLADAPGAIFRAVTGSSAWVLVPMLLAGVLVLVLVLRR